MSIGKVFRDAVSFIPVVRVIVGILTDIIKLSSGSINEIETQIKQIESIGHWLKDNDVNTFSEYYDKTFKEK